MFNFSGTRLYSQGHNDDFSSFTIHAVVYLLNNYLLRARYCQQFRQTDQQTLLPPTFQTLSSLFLALWQSDHGSGV